MYIDCSLQPPERHPTLNQTVMYNPSHFRVADPEAISNLIRRHPLGLLISQSPEGVQASPIPFLYFPEEGEHGILRAHMARANPHWKLLTADPTCLVVFQGEQGYISPSWYASKATTHQVVPTWNYVMAQMRGSLTTTDDADWLQSQISALTRMQETGRPDPWQVTDAPADFIDRQKRAIVGLEIKVASIDGKWKLSQNRSPADQSGVIENLRNSNGLSGNHALAQAMQSPGKTR